MPASAFVCTSLQGKVTISNDRDPATGLWQRNDYLNYTDSISAGSYIYENGFSGATCAKVTFDSDCGYSSSSSMYWYLVEINSLIATFNDGGWSDPTELASNQGLVNSSICAGSCRNKAISLDPSVGYYIMVGNNGDSDSCEHNYTLTTYADEAGDAGSAPKLSSTLQCCTSSPVDVEQCASATYALDTVLPLCSR